MKIRYLESAFIMHDKSYSALLVYYGGPMDNRNVSVNLFAHGFRWRQLMGPYNSIKNENIIR